MLTVCLSDNPADSRRFEAAATVLADILAGVVGTPVGRGNYCMKKCPRIDLSNAYQVQILTDKHAEAN